MVSKAPPYDIISEHAIDARSATREQLIARTYGMMKTYRVTYVRNFPIDPDAYTAFLQSFGSPMPNYSSKSNLENDGPHPVINRVKYKAPKKGPLSVHYIDGSLKVHTARSWCHPRPRFFAMLMVNPGWNVEKPGNNGESVIISWRHLFETLREADGAEFERHLTWLRNTRLTFEANNVREIISDLPLIYDLPDPRAELDLGVRLKQDLDEKIEKYRDQIKDFPTFKMSLDYLFCCANKPEVQASWQMTAGDLIIIDNNRFGHGRHRIVGTKEIDNGTVTNPRELWSVTVA